MTVVGGWWVGDGNRIVDPSLIGVEHLAEFECERLGLAGVAVLAAEEPAVMAREHGHLLAEQ